MSVFRRRLAAVRNGPSGPSCDVCPESEALGTLASALAKRGDWKELVDGEKSRVRDLKYYGDVVDCLIVFKGSYTGWLAVVLLTVFRFA